MITKIERRIKIKYRVRNKISGTAERPRMSVFRSNKQIYVQIINDETATTLVSASSLGMEKCPKCEQAAKVGEIIAKKAIEAEAIAALARMRWSGNIRELRNVVERLIILSGERITVSDIELYV